MRYGKPEKLKPHIEAAVTISCLLLGRGLRFDKEFYDPVNCFSDLSGELLFYAEEITKPQNKKIIIFLHRRELIETILRSRRPSVLESIETIRRMGSVGLKPANLFSNFVGKDYCLVYR